jgi:hypothetical protein
VKRGGRRDDDLGLGMGLGAFNKVMHPDGLVQAACTCRHISREERKRV